MRRLLLLLMGILLVSAQLLAQNRTITGRITDAQGNGIVNASVVVKGTNYGTTTTTEGNYSLNVSPDAKTLLISSVGFQSLEVAIGGKSVISVQLSNTSQDMSEVVVVAYGTSKKEAITGSVGQINGKSLTQRPLTNVANALTGAIAGVQTNAATGQPGSSPTIRLRGFGSINASNDPLYVVDGIPYSGSIANLNTADIENISVLKDAASSALYGARAANGVIMITTKKGKKGRNQIQANISQGVTDREIPEYSQVNPGQYYQLMWEAYRNSLVTGGVPIADASNLATGTMPRLTTGTNKGKQSYGGKAYSDIYQLLGYNPFNVASTDIVRPDGTINPNAQLLYADDLNWFAPLQRKGSRGDYNVNFNGGSEKSDYFVSLGYTDEKGFIIKSDYKRYTGRVNLNVQPLTWFKTGVNLAGTATTSNVANDNNGVGGTSYVNPFFFARNIGPIYPVHLHNKLTGAYVYDASGNTQYDLGLDTTYGTRASSGSPGRHVVAETQWNNNLFKRNVLSARTYGEISFLKNFKFTTNFSTDVNNYLGSTYENNIVGDAAPAGRASKTNTLTTSYTLNELLNYSRSFNKHNFDVLLGHENYSWNQNYEYGQRSMQTVNGNTELTNFTTIDALASQTDNYRTEGYFSRLNYNYEGKYFVSGSYRRDGTSRFNKDSRWGNFWSVGGSWIANKEAFLQNVKWLNSLKLRASYGVVGNDAVLTSSGGQSYYPSQALYSLGNNNAAEPGMILQQIGNKNLVWESNSTFDAGIDFALFRGRFNGSVEYFNRQSSNLLFDVPLPVSSGVTSQTQNIGTMWNKGVEVQLAYDVIRNNTFTWNIGINATTFKNRITKLPPGQTEIISGTKKLMVGHSIYDYWLRDWYGVDPSDGSALYRAATWSASNSRVVGKNDTVTTSQNNALFHYAGSAIPDVYGGISTAFSYKDITLSILLNYQLGGKIYDANYAAIMSAGSYGGGLSSDALARWQKPGDITNVPRMDQSQTTAFNAQSDRWLIDASYLNINAVNVSYNLPKNLLTRMHLQNASFYVSGQNLQMFSKRKGLNPAQSFTGVTSNAYLPARIITVGLNLSL